MEFFRLNRFLTSFGMTTRFRCEVECLVDESKPAGQDKIFCVQMTGQIPTPRDAMDTDVLVELTDITDSHFHPDPVLTVDHCYRSPDHIGFYFVIYNGIIPKKNAVLSSWITVVEIPCHHLRFARRGRRKLLCKVSVLSREDGRVLTFDQQTVEYVFCLDGFKELQGRKIDVLKAAIELSISLIGSQNPLNEEIRRIFVEWLEQKAETFPAAAQLKEWVESFDNHRQGYDCRRSVDGLLGYGEPTDKLGAIELALQVFAARESISAEQFTALEEVAEQLQIKQNRFLELCQKILLFSNCHIEMPSLLLGIDESLDDDAYLSRLTSEYRKWNARVTNPDEEIRLQTDRVLNLIAELRSHRIDQTCL